MKERALLTCLLVCGCTVAPAPQKMKPHPRVIATSHTLSESELDGTTFQAILELSDKPDKVVLSISRMFYRRFFEEEVVYDSAQLFWAENKVRLIASLDQKGKHGLDRFPAHLVLFHRRKDNATMLLGEWWICGEEVFTTRPEQTYRPHLPIQSCERYIRLR